MDLYGKRFSGTLPIGNETIVYAVDNHLFSFYRTKHYIPFSDENSLLKIKPSEDGYIQGFSHDGRKVAIYVENAKLEILTDIKVRTPIYVVQSEIGVLNDDDPFVFTAIRFKGGILNALFSPNALKIEESCQKDGISYKYKFDDLIIPIMIDEKDCSLIINSVITESMNGVTNNQILLTVHLDRKSSLRSFARIYTAIYNMCCFMTFRENINFDMIELLLPYEKMTEPLIPRATCYIYNDFSKTTEKTHHQFVTFELLGQHTAALFDLVYRRNERNESKKPLCITAAFYQRMIMTRC